MNTLLEYLDTFLSNESFTRKDKKTWYKDFNDGQIICQLQRSRYSDHSFLNFGLYFPDLSPSRKNISDMENWHAEGRFEGIVSNTGFAGLFPMTIENKKDIELMKYLEKNLKEKVLPFLEKYSVIATLRNSIDEGSFEYDKMVVALED